MRQNIRILGLEGLKVLLVGVLIGLIVSGFQFLAHEIINCSNYLLNNANIVFPIITIILAIAFSCIMLWYNKKIPGYTGSGIPQYEAYYEGWFQFNPILMFVFVTINSFAAFFMGFLLGGEGPSITIGASISRILNDRFKQEDKHLVAASGSAGFACAFVAPLAGLCHLLEENRHHIKDWRFVLKGIFVVLIATTVSYFVYDPHLLTLATTEVLPWKYYYLLPIILFLGFGFGRLYIYVIVKLKDVSKKIRVWYYLLPIFTIVFMLLKRYSPALTGSGSVVLSSTILDYSLWTLLGILIFRLIFTSASSNQTISGGLVLPMLAVGTLVGAIIVNIFQFFDYSIIIYSDLIMILSMLTVLASVCNTPFTALALALKMAPLRSFFLPLSLISVVIFGIYRLTNLKNIYQQLVMRLPGYKEEKMEYFDILDATGQKTGERGVRGLILKKGKYFGIVNVLSYNQNNEFLITKRHPQKPMGGMWEITAGGVLADEEPLLAAQRELKEETGIDVSLDNLFLITSEVSDSFYVFFYLAKLDSKPEIVLQDKETVDYRWIKREDFVSELRNSDFLPFVFQRITKYQKEIGEVLDNDGGRN